MSLLSRGELDFLYNPGIYSPDYRDKIAYRIRRKIIEFCRDIELIAEKNPQVFHSSTLYALANTLHYVLKALEAPDLEKEFKEIRKAIKFLKDYGKVRK